LTPSGFSRFDSNQRLEVKPLHLELNRSGLSRDHAEETANEHEWTPI
jgi:hypothetical protein